MNVLLRFLIAFSGGILLYKAQLIVLNSWAFAIFGIMFVCLFLFQKTKQRGYLLILLAFSAGFLNTWQKDDTQASNHVIHYPLDSVLAYKVSVSALAEKKKSTYKITSTLHSIKIKNEWHKVEGKILLYIDQKATQPSYGNVLLIYGKPQLVKPPTNPEQFDYQRFLSYQQVFHQHYLRADDFVITTQTDAIWYKKWAYGMSQWCDANLARLIPWPREYAVTKAMVLGLRDDMDFELTQAYSAAGAIHVLSVSGFHIAIFIWLLSLMLSRLQKQKKYGKWLYFAVMIIILWFYAILTGLSPSVLRSVIMISIYLLATPINQPPSLRSALWASALLLLIFDPLLLFSVSFQLSYAALIGLVYFEPAIYQSITPSNALFNKIWEVTSVAIAVQITTFPLATYNFHQFPTYFLLANPAVYVLSFLQLPVALFTALLGPIPYLGEFLGWCTTIVTWLLNEVIVQTDRLPVSLVKYLSLSWVEMLACYGIVFLLIKLWQTRDKQWLLGALGLSVWLMSWQMFENYQQQNQRLLVVHDVPKSTVISIIEGQTVRLLADSSFFDERCLTKLCTQ